MKKAVSLVAAAVIAVGLTSSSALADDHHHHGDGGGSGTRDVRVMATNDIGMHCVCMGFETFMILPPFNTLRAQVIERGGDPKVLADPTDIRVEYNIVEDTKAALAADPYYQNWVDYSPKLFPGYSPTDANGDYVGLTGAKLSGEMEAKSSQGWWEAAGIPAYPVIDPKGVMVDPLGGPNRNPWLTGNVKVYDQSSGALLAETNTTVPTAFGGCCDCHVDLAANNGYPADTRGSFNYMGTLHERDSGINIANIDPDGDGIGGPIRCSQCHVDAAMGESVAPGYAGYPTSQYTFSDVLHRFHAQSTEVLTNWNPNIATDCYQCHPGNNVNCYRGHHVSKGQWCTDCHGDLNQRIAEGQLLQPWSDATLPKCADCHGNVGEGGGYVNTGIFGAYLNSRGHHDHKILCSTCHGEPHGLYPSSLANDNVQNIALQGTADPINHCGVCHTDRSGTGNPHDVD